MKNAIRARYVFIVFSFFMISEALADDAPGNFSDNGLWPWQAPVSYCDLQGLNDPWNHLPGPVIRFYRRVGFQPVWIDRNGLTPQGEVLLNAIGSAASDGLQPDDYLLPSIENSFNNAVSPSGDRPPFDLRRIIPLDVSLTEVMLRYVRHLSKGRIVPEMRDEEWVGGHHSQQIDLSVELAKALNEGNLIAFIGDLKPARKEYQYLKSVLAQYVEISASGGWQKIGLGPSIRTGDRSARVAALHSHLETTGDLPDGDSMDNDLYDASVERAVKRFQYRHGLTEDGIVGKRTQAALDVSVDERIVQLQLNMERWRWLPHNLGSRYLLVNIPAFELSIVQDNAVVQRMRAIVGRTHRQTPVMSGRMTYLELNPYWNIPRRIARRDILPRILDDPSYLRKQGIKVFDSWAPNAQALNPDDIAWEVMSGKHLSYRFRQDPSPFNALGRVKFMFPNRKSVYIHDTPGRVLFNRQRRDFSSGCVRIEKPIVLADYLLDEESWNPTKLAAMVGTGRRQTIVLKNPVPVYLFYFTTWVDESGAVNFREDLYGRDSRLRFAIKQSTSRVIYCSIDASTENMPFGGGGPQT